MKLTVPERSPEENWTIGSLKWTGIRTDSGHPTLGAWVAEMDFGTAPVVAHAMKKAIDDGLLGYQPTWLDGAVRDALVDFQARRFGWDLDSSSIRTVQSVLPALDVVLRNMIPSGAPVIVPTPAYMPFLTMPSAAGHPIIEVPAVHTTRIDEGAGGGAALGWRLDVDAIGAAAHDGAALLILCNPWNPTGRALTRGELEELWNAVRDTDLMVFSDEIHSPLVLEDPSAHVSFARIHEEAAARTVTATAASKGWNIAGLPCAQLIIPDRDMRERWDNVGEKAAHLTNSLGAIGAIAAYRDGDAWQRAVFDVIRSNVEYARRALAGFAVDFTPPQATYLTWWGFDAVDWPQGVSPADYLRERARVGVNDGRTLGRGYEKWIRVNLACSPDNARRIVDAICSALPSAK